MKKGFTLIELLIVIALLGALAIGLLATIDPFEQLKKGRDTATRNTAIEFFNANLRYYGTKGQFPWGTSPNMVSTGLGGLANELIELISAGELKSNFTVVQDANRLNRVYVTSTTADQIAVCFTPESKNFRLDPNSIYNRAGLTTTGCRAQGTSNQGTCEWCVQ